MPTMQEVRAKYPQYNDMSDDQLAGALHKKFYSDMPFDQFAGKIGLANVPRETMPAVKPPLNWSDVPGQALQNAPASAAEFGKALIQPVLHPQETLTNINDLLQGAFLNSKTLQGANSWLADRGLATKRDLETEATGAPVKMAQAFGGMIKDRYGGVDAWKNTMATDPVGFLGDASMLLSGGGSAAARLPGVVGRVGSKALRVAGEVTNPINAVAKPAGLLSKPAAHVIGGLGTGTGGESLMEAFRAGKRGGRYGQSFRDNMRGKVSQESVIDDAKAALDNMAQDRRVEYNKNMAATKANKAVLDMTPIEDAMQKLTDSVFHGPSQITNDASMKMLKKVGKSIDEWKTNFPNPTAEDLDRLKVRIDKLKPNFSKVSGDQERIITTMRNAVKDEILRKDPSYAKTMKAYEDSITTQREIESALSLGKKSSKDTALRKVQSVLRNNANTNYGSRADSVKKLEAAGASEIMAKLAGQSLNARLPRGLAKLATSGALLGGVALGNPALLAALPFMSPRLMGEITHLLGRSGKIPKGLALPAVQAGRIGLLGNP